MFIVTSLRPLPHRMYKYQQADYKGLKRESREFARDIKEQAIEMDSQISGHPLRQPFTYLWRYTSHIRQYVVTRSPNLGLQELSGPYIVNEINYMY